MGIPPDEAWALWEAGPASRWRVELAIAATEERQRMQEDVAALLAGIAERHGYTLRERPDEYDAKQVRDPEETPAWVDALPAN